MNYHPVTGQASDLKSEIRVPEIRKKAKIRNPMIHGLLLSWLRKKWNKAGTHALIQPSDFGLRISFGFRISDFGLRPTAFGFLSLLLLALSGIATATDATRPFVSPMFGDNMVLQRGKTNLIWGWSQPGDTVRVAIAGQTASAQAGEDGRWQAAFYPPAAGGPYVIKIDGAQHAELHEVLVGDVWLCGGQSNMELPLARTRNGSNEIAAASHPEIRLFKVASHPAYSPAAVPQGRWKICSPQTVAEEGGFSAVAYFFARRIQADIPVPVGLVEDCIGGTPAEAWTSGETLRSMGDFDAGLAMLDHLKATGAPEYGNYITHWYDEYDPGQKSNTWAAVDFDDAAWKTVQIPGGFKDLGVPETPAVCWFRKAITLPDPLPAGAASLQLGVVEHMDTTFINGKWVGASAWVENPRKYIVPEGVLKPGRNLVTVRVFKTKPDGGFMSKAEDLRLVLGDGKVIPLAGDWKGAVSVDARPPHPLPLGFENWPVIPSVLYQGMIAPVAPLAITGAIWYQGEANASRAYQYRKLLPAMIGDWRHVFGQGDFPFYIVSLPAFTQRRAQPGDDAWAELREAQAFAAQTVHNAGLAVTIDTGEAGNIHPQDKLVVGERLACCALARHYGQDIAYLGPMFASQERLPGAVKITFTNAAGGLVVKGGQAGEFSVAGQDRQWHWADAKVDGETVTVSSPSVPEPVAVRYAWQSNPQATLFNHDGLPAVPFRTDDWPESTQPRTP
jgi:sialate O-acetylesterase